MIPTVHKRGRDVRGLLAYLYGPGHREEHRNPHIIAAWTGPQQIPWLEPTCDPNGRQDISRLARLLNQPLNAATNPPALTVWHTSVRNHATDRPLTDPRAAATKRGAKPIHCPPSLRRPPLQTHCQWPRRPCRP